MDRGAAKIPDNCWWRDIPCLWCLQIKMLVIPTGNNSRASLFKILQEKSMSPSSILIQVQNSPLIFQGLENPGLYFGKSWEQVLPGNSPHLCHLCGLNIRTSGSRAKDTDRLLKVSFSLNTDDPFANVWNRWNCLEHPYSMDQHQLVFIRPPSTQPREAAHDTISSHFPGHYLVQRAVLW